MYRYRFERTLAACIVLLALAACGEVATQSGAKSAPEAASLKSGGGGTGGHGGGSAPTLAADANVHSMNLTWNDDGVSQYNAYVSSRPDCDIANYTLCPDGQMFVGVRSPYKVGGLENGRVYYAKIETTTTSTRKSTTTTLLSNVAGARPTTLEFNDAVRTIVTAADGTKYVGGDFTRIGLTSGQGAPLDALTGKPAVPAFPMIGGQVQAAAPDGSGGWYLGGGINRVGTLAKSNLVHVRYDGTIDTAWNPVLNGTVNAIAVMNGVVYVGGAFTTINDQLRAGVGAIDAVSGQLMAWNPFPDLGVSALAAANGTIYLGGTFTAIGGFRRSHLAAVDVNGNVLSWDPSPDGWVDALAISGSTVYVGGHFANVAGQPRVSLAAIDAASGTLSTWNASLGCDCFVRAVAISGTTVYVGGSFTQIKGVARNNLAAVDTTNGNVLAWNPNPNDAVWALAVIKDSTRGTTVYAGGDFTQVGGQPYAYLAALDGQGAALSTWQPAPTAHVDVLVASGSQVLAGGLFTGLGASVRNRLAAIDATGVLKSWNPGVSGNVRALALAGSTLYVGGDFTAVGGLPHANLAMVDAATGIVSLWNPGTDKPVNALARSAAGRLYVGGEFVKVAGTQQTRLAVFDVNGSLVPWYPNVDGDVLAVAVGPNAAAGETLYIGGRFGTVNGQVRRRIAQVDEQGQVTAWNPWGYNSVSAGEAVNALAYSNGMIYAAGGFSIMGRNLAQITETGTINPIQGLNYQAWTLAVAGGKLTVGGDFTLVSNPVGLPATRNHVATIDLAAGTLTSFAPNVLTGTVYAVAPEGASLHIGGSFTQINDQVVSGFATLAQ